MFRFSKVVQVVNSPTPWLRLLHYAAAELAAASPPRHRSVVHLVATPIDDEHLLVGAPLQQAHQLSERVQQGVTRPHRGCGIVWRSRPCSSRQAMAEYTAQALELGREAARPTSRAMSTAK